MPTAKTKPRGVVGALSKQVEELRGEIADLREQSAAMKELVGATLRDGDASTSTEYVGFIEYIGDALIAFIHGAGYGAVGRDSVQNTMEGLVDVYKGYLAFCGAPQSRLDDADKRRDEGTDRLNAMHAAHRGEVAAKGGWGDDTPVHTRETVERRSNPTQAELMQQLKAEDLSTWTD